MTEFRPLNEIHCEIIGGILRSANQRHIAAQTLRCDSEEDSAESLRREYRATMVDLAEHRDSLLRELRNLMANDPRNNVEDEAKAKLTS
jgi:hypothetical protein